MRPSRQGFSVSTSPVEGGSIVAVRGELDLATVPALESEVDVQLEETPGLLVLDLAHTTFIDSSAYRLIEKLAKRIAGTGGELVLVVNTYPVRRLFELLPPPPGAKLLDTRRQAQFALSAQAGRAPHLRREAVL